MAFTVWPSIFVPIDGSEGPDGELAQAVANAAATSRRQPCLARMAIVLDRVGTGPADPPDVLWIRKADLPRINDFEIKPQGACRADVCILIDKSMPRGPFFNLTAFARKIGEPVVVDRDARVWSFGEIALVRGQFL